MNILFVHRNFPGQYIHLCRHLLSNNEKNIKIAAISCSSYKISTQFIDMRYHMPESVPSASSPYFKELSEEVLRGRLVFEKARELSEMGFHPDIICAHPGWGEALFLADVFPKSKILLYCEFFHRLNNLYFDPEFLSKEENAEKVRLMNASQLISLDAAYCGVSPTEWQRSLYPDYWKNKISVIHEGINTKLIKPDNSASIILKDGRILTKNDEIITYVSRNLEPCRGLHSFIRSLPYILELRPKANIVLVGGNGASYGKKPPEGKTYKEIFLDEVKPDMSRVHFLGPLPYEKYVKVLQASSVHVYLTYPFVLSWSFLEAMSAGLPVVASDTPPVQEVINNYQNGILVDFFKPENIAFEINKILNEPELVYMLGKNARQTIVDKYDLYEKSLPSQLSFINRLALGML